MKNLFDKNGFNFYTKYGKIGIVRKDKMAKENALKSFENACDNLVKSKYVLIDKSISEILKTIAQNQDLYNYLAVSVLNYNFLKDYKKAASVDGQFLVPESKEQNIAFCFCLLNSIDARKINITSLIDNHFSKDGIEGFDLFCEKIILPFKRNLSECYLSDNIPNASDEIEQKIEANFALSLEVKQRLQYLLNELISSVINLKRIDAIHKNDVCFALKMGVECLIKDDVSTAYGLFLIVIYDTKVYKKLKNQILEIKQLFNN